MKKTTTFHKQKIAMGRTKAAIMPTYGTPSFIYRGKLDLPMVIERKEADGYLEPEKDFLADVETSLAKVAKKIRSVMKLKKDETVESGLWVKWYSKERGLRHPHQSVKKKRRK